MLTCYRLILKALLYLQVVAIYHGISHGVVILTICVQIPNFSSTSMQYAVLMLLSCGEIQVFKNC